MTAQKTEDPCLIAAAATGVVVTCLWLTRWASLRALNFERHLLAGFLAVMPLVYVARYLFASNGRAANGLWIEVHLPHTISLSEN